STQGLTGVLLDADEGAREIVWRHTIIFDDLGYGTRPGVLPNPDPLVATSSPVMWADALHRLMAALATAHAKDLPRISAVSGCGQQHGSVYLNPTATGHLARLSTKESLATQVKPMLSRAESPIWIDMSTTAQCRAIADAV